MYTVSSMLFGEHCVKTLYSYIGYLCLMNDHERYCIALYPRRCVTIEENTERPQPLQTLSSISKGYLSLNCNVLNCFASFMASFCLSIVLNHDMKRRHRRSYILYARPFSGFERRLNKSFCVHKHTKSR